MEVELLDTVGGEFLKQGLLGAIIVALVYFVLMLRRELRDEREAHRVELAKKDALNQELWEKRIVASDVGWQALKAQEKINEELLSALLSKGTGGRR